MCLIGLLSKIFKYKATSIIFIGKSSDSYNIKKIWAQVQGMIYAYISLQLK
jgi:hypothetical protein